MTVHDINHPQVLIEQWRADAARFREHISQHEGNPGVPVIQACVNTLEQCATQLENRLLWSGMLDP